MPSRPRTDPDSPAVRRLPSYLDWLLRMRGLGRKTVSTTELADCVKTGWTAVRKDIALTGVSGRPRVGYDVDRLVDAIREFLGWQQTRSAVLLGAGALGSALLGYDGFERYGLRIDAAFDADPAKAGTTVRGRAVLPLSDLPGALRRRPPDLALLCVPASAAQEAADLLVRHGVRRLWNFSDVELEVPEGVVVRRETVAGGLAALSVGIRNARAVRRRPARKRPRPFRPRPSDRKK